MILLRTLEIEEIHLYALQHLLEEMHHITLSSHKTKEEDGTTANDSDKEKEDKDNNNPNIILPMHCDG